MMKAASTVAPDALSCFLPNRPKYNYSFSPRHNCSFSSSDVRASPPSLPAQTHSSINTLQIVVQKKSTLVELVRYLVSTTEVFYVASLARY